MAHREGAFYPSGCNRLPVRYVILVVWIAFTGFSIWVTAETSCLGALTSPMCLYSVPQLLAVDALYLVTRLAQ
jgi:hypothetical protein